MCPPGKPYRELCELESGIQEQLDSGTAADPEYWQVGAAQLLGCAMLCCAMLCCYLSNQLCTPHLTSPRSRAAVASFQRSPFAPQPTLPMQAVLKRLALHKAKARLREIHGGGLERWQLDLLAVG